MIERDGEQLEMIMSSSGLWWADDDELRALESIIQQINNSIQLDRECRAEQREGA
jgi:hypothetical protein